MGVDKVITAGYKPAPEAEKSPDIVYFTFWPIDKENIDFHP
jgi:hypothetical protein